MKIEVALLEMAQKDLEASKVLFENKLYSQAVFHLQQSVEKAVKSLAIHDHKITEDQLKRLGHDPIKVYIEIIEYWKRFGLALRDSRLGEVLPEFKTFFIVRDLPKRIGQLDEILESLRTNSKVYKSVLISEGRIEQFISAIDGARRLLEKKKKRLDINKEWVMREKQIQRVLGVFDKIVPERQEEIRRLKAKIMRISDKKFHEMKKSYGSYLHGLLDLAFCDASLFYLSLILLPHATYSRYPEKHISPSEIYTANLPLIKKFDQIADIVTEVLSKMSCYIPRK